MSAIPPTRVLHALPAVLHTPYIPTCPYFTSFWVSYLVSYPCNHILRTTMSYTTIRHVMFHVTHRCHYPLCHIHVVLLPPPVSPPAMPYHHPVSYTLFDIPPCHMSHTPPPSVSPCDATCRDHVIQSAYVFFMRDVFGTPCFIAWYVFVVENVFNVLHHPRVTCHPKSPCFARAWLCCFHVTCHPPAMSHPCHVTLPKSMCFLHPKMTPFLCRGYTNFVSTTPKIHPKNDPKNTPKMHP